ncbi:hypothetical protein GH5_05367 [Leishmania sp. Ghana 2012 LV757]|uniref:hypothetical protein n=1 Tax=Leishmania sp. Ghana 2012 LV757 TaxID=2803181 RepID=UPI001B3F040E|nr:hypothetical protein GH5_05367 [Leishmania sp. Ghana 2012 LV757]
MDATWQSSIDRTLRSTEATLEQLQSRRVSYDRAKRKVDDYLGASPNYRDSEPTLDMLDQDWSLPPPLPQHLRYRAARVIGSSPPVPIMLDHATPARRPRVLSSTAGVSDSRPAGPSSSPLQLVNAQVRGALLELELEKAKRADSVRELAYRTTAELAEVRSLITQLQAENGALKKSVRALEGRLGFEVDSHGLHESAVNGVAIAAEGASHLASSGEVTRPPRAATLPFAVANSGFSFAHDASMVAGASASLVARVEALEAGLARQQQQTEDRQTRVTILLRELVKTEVGSEMSQVRALAREAARDSAGDLLKLRLSALQSSTEADLQKALRAASASETMAQHAQQQCRESEQRLSSHMHKLQAEFSEWQRAHSGDASGSAAFSASVSSQQGQERMVTVERRVDEQLRGMQSQLQQYRADAEAQVDRLTQQHKALSSVVQGKAEAAELLAVQEHLEVQQRGGSSEWMSHDQVASLLRTQLQPLQDELRKTQAMAQETVDNAEACRRQTAMRIAAIEANTEQADAARAQQELQWQSCARDVQQVRMDMTGVQSCIAEAVRQARVEMADVWDTKAQLLEERTQQAHRERQQHTDAQLRQLEHILKEQQEAQQRARVTGESAEERLRRTEAALAMVEATLARSVEDVRAKYEALQAAMQQTCVLTVARVQQDVEAVQRKLQAMEEDRARLSNSWTHHLAEAKQYHEERVRHTREVLEQRLAHHKELYEELRTQQALQRRAAEEQHQQLIDRVRHVQQQLMVSSVVAPAPVREQPAEAESTHALATAASATTASTSVSEEYQRSLQLLANRLQDLDERIEAVEGSCANVPLTVADATATIAKRLEGLQDRVEAEADDWRRRHDELERDTELQLGALSRRCSETAASIDAQSACIARRVEESLSPLQLVTHFSADESCLRQLALRLRDHLELTPENATAVADVQAHLEALAKALEAVQASMQEAQREIAALTEVRLADQAPAAAPSSSPEVTTAREEMLNAIRSLQAALEEQRERQDDLEKGLRQLTAQQLATVTTELAEVKRVTDSVPLELARLADQYNAFQSVQRQQLPTLQKYVQDVVEMVQSSQLAQMDPVQLRLRAVEDRHKHLQVRLEEVNATHDVDAAQRAQDLQKKLDQQQQVQKVVEGQLEVLRGDVAATRAEVGSLAERMAAAEQAREHVSGMVTTLQSALSPTNTNEVAAANAEALMAPDAAAQRSAVEEHMRGTADHLTFPGTAVAELHMYIREMDERLTQLEEQTHDSVSVTADMLGAFRDQLQNVVGRFAAAAAQLTGQAEVGGTKETDARDDAAKAGALAATGAASSTQPPIHSLEDVFVFLLHRLYQLHHALRQLQSNTVDTLEILEQHEESVASLPTLQRAVDVMAATLLPLAERLGVDTGAVCSISAQQQHDGHHYVSLFPPSRSSSSCSRISGSEKEGVSRGFTA